MGTLNDQASALPPMTMDDKRRVPSIGNSEVGMSYNRADWQRFADNRAAQSGNGRVGQAHPGPSRVMSRDNGRRIG